MGNPGAAGSWAVISLQYFSEPSVVDAILDSPLRSDRLTRSRVVESKCPIERSALSRKSYGCGVGMWRRGGLICGVRRWPSTFYPSAHGERGWQLGFRSASDRLSSSSLSLGGVEYDCLVMIRETSDASSNRGSTVCRISTTVISEKRGGAKEAVESTNLSQVLQWEECWGINLRLFQHSKQPKFCSRFEDACVYLIDKKLACGLFIAVLVRPIFFSLKPTLQRCISLQI